MANEVAVCVTCHALFHAGLLSVRRNRVGELSFIPKAMEDAALSGLGTAGADATGLPVLEFASPRSGQPGHLGQQGPGTASAAADNGGSDREAEAEAEVEAAKAGISVVDLAHGLVRLGLPFRVARDRVLAAVRSMNGTDLTEGRVLAAALRAAESTSVGVAHLPPTTQLPYHLHIP